MCGSFVRKCTFGSKSHAVDPAKPWAGGLPGPKRTQFPEPVKVMLWNCCEIAAGMHWDCGGIAVGCAATATGLLCWIAVGLLWDC